MIGSWSNRIIEESRCHTWDRHALDRSNRDVNYVALGLALFAAFGWWWADPVAALAVAWFAVREGREAWHGELACDD